MWTLRDYSAGSLTVIGRWQDIRMCIRMQMEKRTEMLSHDTGLQRFRRSRAVLQQGLQLNPHSARICQVHHDICQREFISLPGPC